MDIDNFRAAIGMASPDPVSPCRPSAKPRQHAAFIRGPIPLAWLGAAGRLQKSALVVGLALWFHRGLRKNSCEVIKVTAAVRRAMGLTNDQARRGIHALADAGLVSIVKGGRGRCVCVEIVEQTAGQSVARESFGTSRAQQTTTCADGGQRYDRSVETE